MTQEKRLEDYLHKYGSINPLEAWQDLGIYRLSAVILLLRRRGIKIVTETMDVFNKFGEKCHVAKYVIK